MVIVVWLVTLLVITANFMCIKIQKQQNRTISQFFKLFQELENKNRELEVKIEELRGSSGLT